MGKMKKILDDNRGLIEADFAEVIDDQKTIRYPRTNRKITVPKLTNDFTFVWSFLNHISLSTVFAYLNFFTQAFEITSFPLRFQIVFEHNPKLFVYLFFLLLLICLLFPFLIYTQ
jgi:hypothetical protein